MRVKVRLKEEFCWYYFHAFHREVYESDIEEGDVSISLIGLASEQMFPIEHWEIVEPTKPVNYHRTEEEILKWLFGKDFKSVSDSLAGAAKEIFNMHECLHAATNELNSMGIQNALLKDRAKSAVKALQEILDAGGGE
jgi:hypothetical protein